MKKGMRRLAILAGLLLFTIGPAIASNGPTSSKVNPAATSGSFTVLAADTNASNGQHHVQASISVTGTTDDGGGNDLVCATIYDDGVQKTFQCQTVAVASTVTVFFDLFWFGPILEGAPGVAITLWDATSVSDPTGGFSLLSEIDPLFLSVVGVPVPATSPAVLALLGLLLAGLSAFVLRRRKI
jgi:LPXTG-motif cell wall-anchored protein